MRSVTATARARLGYRAGFARVLLGGVILVGVILGLVAMHTIGHSNPPAATHAAPAEIAMVDSHAATPVTAHGTVGHSSTQISESPEAPHGAPAAAMAEQSAPAAPPLTADGCAGCADGQTGIALMCVFILMVLVALATPRLLRRTRWDRTLQALPRHRFWAFWIVRSRAPSLHMFCISRT